jgi:uroporphyrinogen-III decarboxylase
MLHVFEPNAESLAPRQFEIFSAPYLQQISEKVKVAMKEGEIEDVPMVGFCSSNSSACIESTWCSLHGYSFYSRCCLPKEEAAS